MCLVVRVACGGIIRVGTQIREGNLVKYGRYPIRVGKDEGRPSCSFPGYINVNTYSGYLSYSTQPSPPWYSG